MGRSEKLFSLQKSSQLSSTFTEDHVLNVIESVKVLIFSVENTERANREQLALVLGADPQIEGRRIQK